MNLSNYTIKKMIPRLIIAAILVNASFYIAALAVDISNLLGYNLAKFFEAIQVAQGGAGNNAFQGGWETVIGAILAGAGVVALIAVIIMAPTVLLAVAMVAIILVARKALILLLVVIAPIAFVAYLLPNTEDWFKKWYKAFVALLMVFPIISVVFGASKMASDILLGIAADTGGGDTDTQNMLYVVALGVAAVPLFAVPTLLKGSLAAAGSIGTKLSNLSDKSNRFAKNKAMQGRIGEAKTAFDARRRKRSIERRVGRGKLARWGESRGGVIGGAANRLGTIQKAIDSGPLARRLGADRGQAAAVSAFNKELNEETERQQSTMSDYGAGKLLEIARDSKSQSTERRAAALRQLTKVGGVQHMQAAYDYLMQEGTRGGKDIGDVQQLAASALLDRRPAGVGKTAANSLVKGQLKGGPAGGNYNDSLRQRLRDGKFDERDFAKMDVDDLARFAQMRAAGKLSAEDIAALSDLENKVRTNDNISLSDEQQHAVDQAILGAHDRRTGAATARATAYNGGEYRLVDLDAPPRP